MTKLKSFKYTGLLTVFAVFLGLAITLFIERQGISYKISKEQYTYVEGPVITADSVMQTLEKKTLVIMNSTDPSSVLAKEQFQQILKDMKAGYELVDIASSEVPAFDSYEKVVVLISDLSSLNEKLVALSDWVYNGGNAQFVLTLQKSSHLSLIEQQLGIKSSTAQYKEVDKIYIEPSFMIGGGKAYVIEEPFESALQVELEQDVTIHASRKDEDSTLPLIWEKQYGKGKFVVDNIGIYNKVTRGIYAASYSLLGDITIYPVINGSVYYLDDFPSPVPSGEGKYVQRDYNVNIATFYTNIWWPDLLNLAKKYGIKYTGVTIENYEDDTSGKIKKQEDTTRFLYFGNMLLRNGGEIGYHGYNHQPLSPKSVDYRGVYSYHTWESEQAMTDALRELVRFNEELFPKVEKSVYVPPSNVLSPEGREVIRQTIPEIKSISSNYFSGDFAYEQEFEWASDGIVEQPRIISGGNLDDFMKLAAFSELNMHFVNNHFMHPDDPLDVDRGAELGWKKLREGLEDYISWLHTAAPDLRELTGSQLAGAIQRFSALVVKHEVSNNGIQITFDNFYDEAYTFVRVNKGTVGAHVTGGNLKHLTGNLYLLHATQDKVTIEWIGE